MKVSSPPEGVPRITPYLTYRDPSAALEWLQQAFGFVPRATMPDPRGGVMHAEMTLHDGLVMFGPPHMGHERCAPTFGTPTSVGLYVYVDDVDAHFERARTAGARIVSDAPMEMFWGDRIYTCYDCEGHQWTFAQAVRAPGAPESATFE